MEGVLPAVVAYELSHQDRQVELLPEGQGPLEGKIPAWEGGAGGLRGGSTGRRSCGAGAGRGPGL